MSRSSFVLRIVRIVVLAALSVMFVYLFTHEAAGDFPSDMPAHIRTALSDEEVGYSLVYPFLAVSYTWAGPFGVGIFLTIVQIATMVVSEMLMRRLMPDVREWVVFVLALAANFLMAIYLPVLHPHFSYGLSVGNAWHNSTYLAMKLIGLGAIWGYLRFVDVLESTTKVRDWIILTACIVAAVAVKPSFATVFGPTVVIMCVYDLVHEGPKTVKRSLALAVPFVIVLCIMIYQYTLLYVEDTSSGIGFSIARVWRHTHFFFPLGMLQSYAFPFFVFVFYWKKLKDDYNYRMSLVMFTIGLIIYLFVNETGERAGHGNMAWGLKFAVYYLFITSMVAYFRVNGKKLPFILKAPVALQSANAAQDVLADTEGAVGSEEDGLAEAQPQQVKLAFWPELFTLMILGFHAISGIAAMIKIVSGNGYA